MSTTGSVAAIGLKFFKWIDLSSVEHDSRIEQPVGIEQPLDPPHQVGCLLSPFHFDEGRHVAARAVLGLERAVVAPDNDLGDVVHEGRVAVDRLMVGETLREDEVQVAVERMAEDDRFWVAVSDERRLQISGRRGEPVDRNGDILDDDRRAGRAHRADCGKQPLSDLPVFFDGIRIGR